MSNKNTAGKSGQENSGARNSGTSSAQNSGSKGRSEGLKRLFEHQLKDMYYVEKQLLQHLPKMAEAAQNEELVSAFKEHLQETEGHVKRLETIFKELGTAPTAKRCEPIEAILKEGRELMQEFKDDPALDAALVCAAQKVEHYEITSYGSLCAFAEQLGMDRACDEIEAILDEEKAADDKLSDLAVEVLNIEADTEENSQEEDDEEEGKEGAEAGLGSGQGSSRKSVKATS